MKRIIIDKNEGTINLSDVDELSPVFAKRGGILQGMVVKESEGWILRTGGTFGATGHHPTLRGCIESCAAHKYEFFVETGTII